MAHIEDRWFKTVVVDGKTKQVPTKLRGKGMRYRARYLDPSGRERSKSFPDKQKKQAEAFLATTESDKQQGTYLDPHAGKVLFKAFADEWLAGQTFDESTREVVERRLRLHIYPTFGHRQLGSIRASAIRAWDRALQQTGLAASFRRVLFAHLNSILNAAVDDGRIVKNPCSASTVRAPKVEPRRVIPWKPEAVRALQETIEQGLRVVPILGAGCGLRIGEVLGLGADDIDEEDELLHVRRQLKVIRGQLVFGLPKGRKVRDVPLPSTVGAALKEHIQHVPPVAVTLPWEKPDGKPVTVELVVTRASKPLPRTTLMKGIWPKALVAAGIAPGRENGPHALRHFYASVLLDAGESIKALSEYLGHHDAAFTLRTYTHLMPSSEARTRRAVDEVLGDGSQTSDGLATAWGPGGRVRGQPVNA